MPAQELYRRFLFYKYFIALWHPLVVCEGRTDNISLKYAIRHLADRYPLLCNATDKGVEATVSLFNYENHAHTILDLTGGSK